MTAPDPFAVPRVEALSDNLGGMKFLTKLNMTKGFWQISLDSESIPSTGFVTPTGHLTVALYEFRFAQSTCHESYLNG